MVDGRYEVLQRIGSGGMADVWLAEDTHLQRRVALKVLHARFVQDREFVERFRREAEAAAGLQHPNVVSVFDRGDVNGTYYIAMQYLEGRTLKQLIDAGLSPEQAVPLIRQVLEGARFAHRNGIVHRDLKPQNVIVDGDDKATVTDFGIAQAGVSEITQTGSVMGTPHYLSPEQAQGQEVTASSDLYSIGVMLYEALTGRVPFEGDSAVAVAMKQVSQAPQRPSSINPKVSPALDAIVMRALEKEPGQRFQSADAFIAALDAALREPSGERTARLPSRRFPRRRDAGGGGRRGARFGGGAGAQAQPPDLDAGCRCGPDRPPARLRADPRHNHRGPRRDRQRAQRGDRAAAAERLQRRRRQEGRARFAGEHRARAGPAAAPPGDEAALDCAFLSFFCSKPKVMLTVSAGPGTAKIPSTAGLSAEEAEDELEGAGFDPRVESVASEKVEEGLVVNSLPSGGSTATRGSEVVLRVSSGPKLAKVPVLVGTQRSVAVQQIRSRGFVPSVEERESASPAGQVISQAPSAGSQLPARSTVSIVVSKGEETAEVPNVIGQLRAEAVEAVRAAGLKPTVSEQQTEVPSQVGRATDQFPPPGAELKPGETVTVVVGKAAAGATEPEAGEEE